ncbi:hypothetical protein DFR56_11657 [Pseudogracilibacillus auburnensis]|uniref:PAC domain-containing protein n=1 Tax=Pseudogracilibacillus auburnensis TaxID=1494959 RepID=A0A2V3VRP7_9BACI|nr:hypothetical protein DFR56_11657 [Pseudogracilibacillus auburnensis]
MALNNLLLIVNITAIKDDDGEVAGVVGSFRDKTEINEMLATLSEIHRYLKDLRAHTLIYKSPLCPF